MRKTYIYYVLIGLFLFSCTEDNDDLDKELRFAINTAKESRGLSYYILPQSNDFSAIPQDLNNPLTAAKVALGQQLFHESGFGTKGEFEDLKQTYSCASCHHAAAGFQANMMQGIGEGGLGFGMFGEGRRADKTLQESKVDVQPLRSPSILNAAYQTNMLWNGQFGATGMNENTRTLWPDEGPISINKLGYEGLETQAIAGLTVHRHEITKTSVTLLGYKEMFDRVFSNVPENERYSVVTAGLAISAYERTVLSNQSPFQHWLRGDGTAMTDDQKKGAMLFFGSGNCISCHNGPSLAKMDFYAIGMNDFDPSRVLNYESDNEARFGRASFTKNKDDNYKFKVPQLYNLKDSPFYGHGSSFSSVGAVIAYKNIGIPENKNMPQRQLSDGFYPLDLSMEEVNLITAFIEGALYDSNLSRYVPVTVKSGACFPNNDWMSRRDLGCD